MRARMAPIERLPTELVSVILAYATRDGRRRSLLCSLALVSPAFADAARLLSTRCARLVSRSDALAFITALQRDPSPARRAAAVKHLAITYRTCLNEPANAADPDQAEDPVPASLAVAVLYFSDRLVSLDLTPDDGLALLDAVVRAGGAGGISNRLERCSVSGDRVRWDRLVRLLSPAKRLAALKVDGLYLSATAERGRRNDEGADGDAAAPPSVHVASEPENGRPRSTGAIDIALTATSLGAPDRVLPSHFDYTLALPALLDPLPFPTVPLRTLHLHQLEAPDDGPFVSLIAACHRTLDSLTVTDTTSISRYGLVAALRMLPSLTELDLSNCHFFPERDPVVARRTRTMTRGHHGGGGGGGIGTGVVTRQAYLEQLQWRQQQQEAPQRAIQANQQAPTPQLVSPSQRPTFHRPVVRGAGIARPAPQWAAPRPFLAAAPAVAQAEVPALAPPAVPVGGFAPFLSSSSSSTNNNSSSRSSSNTSGGGGGDDHGDDDSRSGTGTGMSATFLQQQSVTLGMASAPAQVPVAAPALAAGSTSTVPAPTAAATAPATVAAATGDDHDEHDDDDDDGEDEEDPAPPKSKMVVLPTSVADNSFVERSVNASLRLLEPDSASRRALLDPIAGGDGGGGRGRDLDDFYAPLDRLDAYCPFLHELTLDGTDQVLSSRGIERVLVKVPLERATLGFVDLHAVVPVRAVEAALQASKGRLDALTITLGMRWSEEQLAALRASPAAAGVQIGGQGWSCRDEFARATAFLQRDP
ncbi:hypothetical protein JCM3774_000487 [Rhodotorula dairenensis]